MLRIALTLSLPLLVACSAPPPFALPPPLTGEAGPPIRVAALEVGYTPTPDRARYATGKVADTHQGLVCRACGERLVNHPRDDALPDCPDCEAPTEWVVSFLRPFRPRINGHDVAAEVARLLQARGGFKSAKGPVDAAPRDPAAWRTLSVKLDRAKTKYVDSNWLMPVKVVLLIGCSILIFPAVDPPNWFLPSEIYGIEQRATWTVRSAGGQTLAQGRVEVTTQDTFAAFGFGATRPFFIIGFLRVPNCFDEEDWGVVSGQLEERAQVDLARAIVKAVEAKRAVIR